MKTRHPIDLKAIAGNAMRKYGFEPRFPDAVVREVNALPEKTLPADRKETQDLRMLLWSSIDNHDSMDLDQLNTANPARAERYR